MVKYVKCARCKGTGTIRKAPGLGFTGWEEKCDACNGAGTIKIE
jgi:DnaJ-class molecular chaperone